MAEIAVFQTGNESGDLQVKHLKIPLGILLFAIPFSIDFLTLAPKE